LQFFCPQTNRWFVGFESQSIKSRQLRIGYIRENIANSGKSPYTEDDVARAAELLTTPGTQDEVSALATRLVGRLFIDEHIPDNVVKAARETILDIPVGPLSFIKSAHAQSTVYNWVVERVEKEHVEDVCHNLGAGAQGVLAGLEAVRTGADAGVVDQKTLRKALLDKPLIAKAVRMAVGSGTVGGMLAEPLVPDVTMIMLEFGAAATSGQDDNFLFGPGPGPRTCPFKSTFLNFAGEIAEKIAAAKRVDSGGHDGKLEEPF
jgi:hypothetical protein